MKHFVWAVVMMAIGACTMVACEKDKPQQPQQQDPQQQEVTDDSLYMMRHLFCPLGSTYTYGHEIIASSYILSLWREKVYVFNSQDEFDSIFPACELPVEVDFSTQTLIVLINFTWDNPGPGTIDQYWQMVDDTMKVTVMYTLGGPFDGGPYQYAFTVDKLTCGQVVDIDLQAVARGSISPFKLPTWQCTTDNYSIKMFPNDCGFRITQFMFSQMPPDGFDSVFTPFAGHAPDDRTYPHFQYSRQWISPNSVEILTIDSISGNTLDTPILMQIEHLDRNTQRWTNITPGADTNSLLIKEFLFKRVIPDSRPGLSSIPRQTRVKCEN